MPPPGSSRSSGSPPLRMSRLERRAAFSLAGVFSLRMLGLFIVLPVLAVFAETLEGGRDRTLVGLAFGAYGLTQAALQIPFGWLSDRLGRKPVLYTGLAIFAVGSLIAALASHIGWMIVGRILQGAGAISAVAIAALADLTRLEVRTRAMALVGATIGLTFMISLVAGPLLTGAIGVPGLFALTAAFALAGIAVVRFVVPNGASPASLPRADGSAFVRVLTDRELLRLNFGIFALHAVLVMMFLEVPHALQALHMPVAAHWQVYLPVLIASVLLMLPAMMQADRPERAKAIFAGAIALLLVAHVLLFAFPDSLTGLVGGLLVFFTAFNLLEAKLPALVSKLAPADVKGTAIGVYSSVQFFGVFVGGAVGGWLQQHYGAGAIFWLGMALTAVWLVLAIAMPSLATYNLSLAKSD